MTTSMMLMLLIDAYRMFNDRCLRRSKKFTHFSWGNTSVGFGSRAKEKRGIDGGREVIK